MKRFKGKHKMSLATNHFTSRIYERYGFTLTVDMQLDLIKEIRSKKYPCLAFDYGKERYKINMFGNVLEIIYCRQTNCLITVLTEHKKISSKRMFKTYFNKSHTSTRSYNAYKCRNDN